MTPEREQAIRQINAWDDPVLRARLLAAYDASLPPRPARHGDICPALSYPKDHSGTWYPCSICGGFVRL